MKRIKLSQGQHALVDDEDFDRVSAHRWHAVRKAKGASGFYARTSIRQEDGSYRGVYLHRFLLGEDGPNIDHRDGNGLNNQRENLRPCKHQENIWNKLGYAHNTSGFQGVCWDNERRKWLASIQIDGKSKFLGRYDDPIAAAKAYDAKAREIRGEFARTNFS